METCDCCGTKLGNSSMWLELYHKVYKFCSVNCMEMADPLMHREIVI
jgi:hypothetical protein